MFDTTCGASPRAQWRRVRSHTKDLSCSASPVTLLFCVTYAHQWHCTSECNGILSKRKDADKISGRHCSFLACKEETVCVSLLATNLGSARATRACSKAFIGVGGAFYGCWEEQYGELARYAKVNGDGTLAWIKALPKPVSGYTGGWAMASPDNSRVVLAGKMYVSCCAHFLQSTTAPEPLSSKLLAGNLPAAGVGYPPR